MVVDVSNSPSFADAPVMDFFQKSTTNLLAAEAAAGVRHHVALSVVGTERLTESGYFRAKIVQEKLIKGSSIPYSIVRATQFFEFVKSIADIATEETRSACRPRSSSPSRQRMSPGQSPTLPWARPRMAPSRWGGPEQFRLDELIRQSLSARNDPREVVTDPHARYSGAKLEERTLVAGEARSWGDAFQRVAEPVHDFEVARRRVASPLSSGATAILPVSAQARVRKRKPERHMLCLRGASSR